MLIKPVLIRFKAVMDFFEEKAKNWIFEVDGMLGKGKVGAKRRFDLWIGPAGNIVFKMVPQGIFKIVKPAYKIQIG